jgi:hypothetical protein
LKKFKVSGVSYSLMKKIFRILIILFVLLIIVFFGYSQITQDLKTQKSIKKSAVNPIALSPPQYISKPGYYKLTADLAPTDPFRASSNYLHYSELFLQML